jgi:hypothetical protein
MNVSVVEFCPGANPPIAFYNASVVNFYNATISAACFETKPFSIFKNALAYSTPAL